MKSTLETLESLIGFDTVSAKSNLAMIDYIESVLQGFGARTHRINAPSDDKCGLYAEIGPPAEAGILLSGHTDVVPVDGQPWTKDPFKLTREDDYLYGRGTTDMKGYLASMLHAARLASNAPLKAPLKLVFSYDEEIGCVGIQDMLPSLTPLLGQPEACFVGEPTGMQIAIGHKGKAALRAICHGQSGHSALAPKFVNALHLATDLVIGLKQLQSALESGPRDDAYDIPYSTVHAGKLTSGTALNIIPDKAELVFEYRHIPADTPEMLLRRITDMSQEIEQNYKHHWPGAKIEIDRYNAYPGLDVPISSPAVTLAQSLLETHQTGKVAFGTEAGFFDGLGISTVVCGPGSMEGQGHKPDEYLEIGQLQTCNKMMERMVEHLCR